MADQGRNPTTIPINELGIEQLSQLQKQVEQEYAFFAESAAQLKMFIDKNQKSILALENLENTPAGEKTLIPLSESMYIRAELSDPSLMLVEIGTGYYAEMTRSKAVEYFERKKKYIKTQLDIVDNHIADKKRSRSILQESFQQKIAAQLSSAKPK
ncbi:unnamed protein product [Auanema sp. JU1783]|nr:unnamed protein product [Auanema sp. JU1783]